MLDMGRPVRIVDLAERIIALAGGTLSETVSIEFTGLRPGEKLSEQLFSTTESVVGTSHPKIMLVRGPAASGELLLRGIRRLVELAERQDEEGTRRLLFELAAEHRSILLDGLPTHVGVRLEATGTDSASVPAGRQ